GASVTESQRTRTRERPKSVASVISVVVKMVRAASAQRTARPTRGLLRPRYVDALMSRSVMSSLLKARRVLPAASVEAAGIVACDLVVIERVMALELADSAS